MDIIQSIKDNKNNSKLDEKLYKCVIDGINTDEETRELLKNKYKYIENPRWLFFLNKNPQDEINKYVCNNNRSYIQSSE